MNALTKYSDVQLTNEVKRSFEENYLKMLFEKHKDLPKSDIVEFIHKAQQTGANPSLNQIFLIERNTKVGFEWKKVGTVVFSYNFIQAVANQTGDYEGYTIKTEMVNKFDIQNFKEIRMLASTCVVKRKGREFPYTAYFDEYVQTKENKTTGKQEASGTWASKPYMMIEKCALSGALRRAFPEALSGMYCEEEMESISNELDKQVNSSAIEVESVKKIESTEKIIEQAKTENYEEKDKKLAALSILLGDLSKGKTIKEKSSILFDLCGVTKYTELKIKSTEEITTLFNKVSEILDETNARELQKEKNKSKEKHSFVLES